MSRVIVAESAGFCFGVKRAIAAAQKVARDKGSCCTLGPLIHNNDVILDLARHGVRVVNTLDECHEGETLIIRSHGVPQSVYLELERRGIHYVDATCPFVAKIHKIVSEYSAVGCGIIVAGDPVHPEVLGILGHCAGKTDCNIAADSTDDFIKALEYGKIHCDFAQIAVAQTTFDRLKWQSYQEIAKNSYTKVKFFDTICSATTKRQSEAAALAQVCDLMIVLGGFHSSNSQKLADICTRYCQTVFAEKMCDDITAALRNLLSRKTDVTIGITAGASTPAHIIKEVHSIMSEALEKESEEFDFLAEVDKTFKRVYIGNRVKAYVIAVNKTEAVVDIGTKHSGYIPADELTNNPSLTPADVVKVGDEIECVVTSINDAEGVVYLSKKRVDAALGIEKISNAKETNATLDGVVSAVVKGGLIVVCDGARVFVPASQSGVPRNGKLEDMAKKEVKFKVIEVNETRSRVVGSIKAAMKEELDAVKAKFWSEIEVGQKFTGEVKSIESYGVFVDLGGVDGMVHSSELTWNRIKHPKEIVNIGDKLDVYVKSFDPEKKRVSLGAKDPNDNPWLKFTTEFNVGDVVNVQIVSITPFGAFAQIIPGVDGLIHISQISLDRVTNVAQVLSVGQTVDAKITEIDVDKTRVSLSIKALLETGDEDNAEEAPVEE